MARPARPEQLAALTRIRECMAEHGEEVGARLARADFPKLDKATWSRWCKQVREENARFDTEPPSVTVAPVPAKSAPVQPAELCAVEPGVIDFYGQLAAMLEDCDLVRSYAAPVDPATGARKPRNPMMLVQATKLRATVLALAQRHAEAAWDVEMVRRQHEALIGAIGDALKASGDRELTAGIIRELQMLEERRKARSRYLGAADQLEQRA
ncbi:hypothetical protein [Ralstonia pseudosolanacearum]|uniref:hypothetical protein n=1 Tax=Ralstonia pseudosolanacearum TaxID=1310165 RepID=UPI00048E8541|nr:hypothetical protein [Ralstonia pseudosolanacearum]MDO3558281.1 hypothetical protein [Ralstonia pseudosolanacearum]MDO3575526.1 hypothetical protein [Ralstonia pseudosolanacearum]MDO3586898.1 hypothetical protein [Ralstonia pseudosolanacearum]